MRHRLFFIIVCVVLLVPHLEALACQDPTNVGWLERIGRMFRHKSSSSVSIPIPPPPRAQLDGLTDALGFCAVGPKTNFAAYNSKSGSMFKLLAMEKSKETWAREQAKHHWKKADGTPLTQKEFVAMDALARTLFAEMGTVKCADEPNMTAVARVILNRVEAVRQNPRMASRFTDGLISDSDSDMIRYTCLANMQFSLWNKLNRGNQVSSLKQALCPKPLLTDKNGKKFVDPNVEASWRRAAFLAMRVIANPGKIRRSTGKMSGPGALTALYYTSDIPMTAGNKDAWTELPLPKVDGVQLTDKTCIRLWRDETMYPKKKKAAAKPAAKKPTPKPVKPKGKK